MLSNLLSLLFKIAFFFTVVFGGLKITASILNRDIESRTERSQMTFAWPGIEVTAEKLSSHERKAGDTTIIYKVTDSSGMTVSSGSSVFNKGTFPGQRKRMKENLDSINLKITAEIDTTITAIRESPYYPGDDNVTVIEIKPSADRFDEYPTNHFISEMSSKSQLRIHVNSITEHILYALVNTIKIGCAAFIFLLLSRLFRNFSNKQYFIKDHIRILRNIGWLLLIPQATNFFLYWVHLVHLRPVKIQKSGSDLQFLAQYQITSGIEYIYVFLGLGTLILSYIFRDALLMKQENELTI